LVDGYFPNELKCAKIIPIFKNGDSLSTSNYRPISILSDFSKIFEQCIFERIYNFAIKFNLIDKCQFGFQRKSGTLSAAMCLLNDIRTTIDLSNKNIAACLFLDLTKAFDTIFRYLLMCKLYRYGFRGKIHDLINSYLNNRTQYTDINNIKSNTCNIEYGTPQGSTLGPLLFLIFINDIFKLKLNGKIIMFADDAAISYSSTNVNDLSRMMREDMIVLSNWFEVSRPSGLNSLDCSAYRELSFGHKNLKIKIYAYSIFGDLKVQMHFLYKFFL
jgi:Reverse transcriptase (RNA-dependent DNA polymerase)